MTLEIWVNRKVVGHVEFRKAKRAKLSNEITKTVIPLSPEMWWEGKIKAVSLMRHPCKDDEIALSILTA